MSSIKRNPKGLGQSTGSRRELSWVCWFERFVRLTRLRVYMRDDPELDDKRIIGNKIKI